jgi:hypothetical protein
MVRGNGEFSLDSATLERVTTAASVVQRGVEASVETATMELEQ